MTTPQMDWLDDQRRKRAVADDIVTRLRHAEDNGICEWQVLIDAADEIERLRSIGKSHYGPHHDPMWCPVCDRAWPCPTWIQFFGEGVRRGVP